MGSPTHYGSEGNNSGEGINNDEVVKELFNTYPEGLFGSGRGCLIKGKGKVSDTLPPLPPNAKRFQPLLPFDFMQGTAAQTMVEANQLVHSNISCGHASSLCYEVEDVSTESDELATESNVTESADVMKDFVHSVEGHDKSSASNDFSVDFLALKGNMVDGGGNLIQEHLDNKGLNKACSCSFCLKAAHMWTDLTLQDTRGRLSELQKSKKRTKDCVMKVIQDTSKTSKSAKLEIDLLQQWTSLFQHTHEALVHEITRTESNLEVEGKMMEKCKKELELRSGVFPHGL